MKTSTIRIPVMLAGAIATTLALASCQNINIADEDEGIATPTGLAAVVNGTTVELDWVWPTGANTFTVYWKKDSPTVSALDFSGTQAGVTTNSFDVPGLDAGYPYAFMVVAVGTGGVTSEPSSTATATPAATVPAPSFGVPAGTYIGDLGVAIGPVTAGTASAVIKYTTDGSAPSRTNGTELTTDSVTLTTSCVLKAMAYVPSYAESTDSAVVEAAYALVDLYYLALDSEGRPQAIGPSGGIVVFPAAAQASAMVVTGGSVFVAGSAPYWNGTSMVNAAAFWKDGAEFVADESGTASMAYGIAVDAAGTVYLAGEDGAGKACYWICPAAGGSTKIALSDLAGSRAAAIFLTSDATPTVYAAGYDYLLTDNANIPNRQGCYWIGTAKTALTTTTGRASQAVGVAFDGTRVLTAGFEEGEAFITPKYWQDTAAFDPAGLNSYGQILACAYAGGEFLMAGSASGKVAAWTTAPGATPAFSDIGPLVPANGQALAIAADGHGSVWYAGSTGAGAALWIDRIMDSNAISSIEYGSVLSIHPIIRE